MEISTGRDLRSNPSFVPYWALLSLYILQVYKFSNEKTSLKKNKKYLKNTKKEGKKKLFPNY